MTEYFIALDTHCAFCEMSVVTTSGKLVCREQLPTSVPALREAIAKVRSPRRLTFEEGPLANWLSRELRDLVTELVVCEPTRNHWIARDGDKDDPIDARKLADLYRGGYLKPVHQSDSLKRSLLKQTTWLYHDRVGERVRQGHQLVALFRRHGVFAPADKLVDEEEWQQRLRHLPRERSLHFGLKQIRDVYLLMLEQEDSLRTQLIGLARNEEPVRRFQELPGIAWIRGVTFYVAVDTPWRFRSKEALWKYCNIGLERRHSGNGPTRMRLSRQGNRRLKNVLLGAAQSAIGQAETPFADKYRNWMEEKGLAAPHAKRNVARCLATTMWSLWKTGQRYDPSRATVPEKV